MATNVDRNTVHPTAYDRETAIRALRWLGLSLLTGLLAGGLAAAPIYNGLVQLGRAVPLWAALRELQFTSVASRCALIATVAACGVAIARGCFGSPGQIGLRPGGTHRWFRWYVVGIATMVALYGAGALVGAYRLVLPPWLEGIETVAAAVLSGVLVGVIEEVAFRGLLYGAARAVLGTTAAAIASSFLFSLVHFADPVPYVAVAHAAWYDGLLLLGTLFRFIHAPHHYVPFAATLVAMGWVLCRLYERRGHLGACIGLHAGWVAGLFGFRAFVERRPEIAEGLFGAGPNPAYGWGAFLVVLGWLVVFAWMGNGHAAQSVDIRTG